MGKASLLYFSRAFSQPNAGEFLERDAGNFDMSIDVGHPSIIESFCLLTRPQAAHGIYLICTWSYWIQSILQQKSYKLQTLVLHDE